MGLVPSLGLQYETAARNLDNRRTIAETGGSLLSLQGSMEAVWGDLMVSVQAQQPLVQHLGNGHLRACERLSLHLTHVF